jgi:hypothetical protein
MKLGFEIEYTGNRDPVPSVALMVTIPWRTRPWHHGYWPVGWKTKVWRFYL